MFTSLGAKIGAVVFVLCASLLALSIVVFYDSHEALHAEMRQRFGLAVIREEISEDEVAWTHALDDKGVAAALLARAAHDNPRAALYLLDRNGDVLAASISPETKQLRHVDVAPLERVLAGERRLPIRGDNPVDPSHPGIFAVAAVPTTGPVRGYFYMVLAEDDGAQNHTPISANYAIREGAILLAGWAVLVLLAVLFVMKVVIRPLQRLTESVQQFQQEGFNGALPSTNLASSRDEIGRLAQSFAAMAERIKQQVEELRKHDADRRELFANISHDLRTPMASLLGYLETIAVRPNLPEEEKTRYCEIAMQEARHLAHLVDGLLELAKLDAPRAAVNTEAFALPELIETVCRTFELIALERGVSLVKSVAVSEALPLVFADPALIQRALDNLVDNALRHTPAGGTVTIAAAAEAKGIGITVSDTGTGIPAEELAHIFDRYYRGRRTSRSEYRGTGLGLPIARRILELHGAALTVDSEPGVYTRFRFVLPLAGANAAVAA